MNNQQYTRIHYKDEESDEEQEEEGNVLDNIVDLKQINARLQDWFAKIKSKQSHHDDNFDRFAVEIHSSVFTPTIAASLPEGHIKRSKAMSTEQFDRVIDSVREAINAGTQPRLVTKGSSGSYFAIDKQQRVVGIFKPKNEEPYGQLNPKWTKWLHRNLFPCFFGRSCLIPNLSYISEAAACLLDRQLQTDIVPPTDVVWLSSTSFNYDYFDRRAYANKAKPLPPKQGSFQVFLEGYSDATEFLREHPWPDSSPQRTTDSQRRSWTSCVGGSDQPDNEAIEDLQNAITSSSPAKTQFWTPDLMQSFREELEKLVILDYIMRNTDRGLDNWMLKITPGQGETKSKVSIVAASSKAQLDVISQPPSPSSMSRTVSQSQDISDTIQLGAIDNSLAFPWKHPDEWRSFPFGWLFLPASLIGQPFSTRTKQHFLPLLTDPAWWRETTSSLKGLFSQDADFQEKMFARQMAVLKGQAWNVVETLKSGDQGPLELARRSRLHVWTDTMEVPVTVPSKKINIRQSKPKKHAHFGIDEEIDLGVLVEDPSGLTTTAPASTSKIAFTRSSSDFTGDLSHPRSHFATRTNRASFEDKRLKSPKMKQPQRRPRGMSLGMKSSRFGGDEESDLGDLGYGLMHDEERSTKQVVVERLETVHGAEAFFSWC